MDAEVTYNPMSILMSVKELLTISYANEDFDTKIILHINSALPQLFILGVSDNPAFRITDDANLWADCIPVDNGLISLATYYIYLLVKLEFDPPLSGAAINIMTQDVEKQAFLMRVIITDNK